MKKSLLFLAVIAGIVACKKGDEDPAFTLATRKARLSGEWTIKSYTANSTWMEDGETINTTAETGSANNFNLTSTYQLYSIEEDKEVADYSLTIKKDGTWSQRFEFDFKRTVIHLNHTQTTEGHRTIEKSGNWAFIKNTKDVAKNKERVVFYTTAKTTANGEATYVDHYPDGSYPDENITLPAETIVTNYNQGDEFIIYDILMLKSKQMKWTLTEGYTQSGLIINKDENFVWVAK